MIQKMKKHLLKVACILAVLAGMTSCEGYEVPTGKPEESIELTRCWHLVSIYGAQVEADIHIDFGKDGKFAIYQRTEELTYTVFNGTYTADEATSVISGVYDDGTEWLTSYNYVVDKEAKTLTLTSVNNPSEVSVYEPSKVPASATMSSRSATANDVKPL